jgi:hypothetical protein
MNIHTTASTSVPAGVSAAEWEARADLAAVYRLVAHYGWDDVIYNHVRTPDKAGQSPAFSGS